MTTFRFGGQWGGWSIMYTIVPVPKFSMLNPVSRNPSAPLIDRKERLSKTPHYATNSLLSMSKDIKLGVFVRVGRLDGLDLEVQGNETEHQRLEVLNEVVEDAQAFWVGRVRNIVDRSNFGSLSPVLALNILQRSTPTLA